MTNPFDPLVDQLPSRYVIGIDLGTTNSAVTYVDTHASPWQVRVFPIPQLVAPGQVEARETLPSFCYCAAEGEMSPGALRLPWHKEEPNYAVGVLAREEGLAKPGRLIVSAKSWLCHSGVDRTADLLPWQGAADVERMSPVDASARYLQHIHDAWNHRFADAPLADQDVALTLPASFDEVARELTIEAARRAGLNRVVLIEEPQAAFYAWVYKHAEDWDRRVSRGQKILVADIGGGTSDFTLIRVRRDAADEQAVQFHRVAVGEHLILGGDNLDLALARYLEQKVSPDEKLPPRQWDVLVRSCRRVKETMMSEGGPEQLTVSLPPSGAKLIGGALQVPVTRDEVQRLLLEGFLPPVALDEKPQRHQSGFQEFGLPYAADAGITRYLASFLETHRHAGDESSQATTAHDPARPDLVLFNGGFFASPMLRGRLLDVLASWFRQDDPDWQPEVLDNDRLDLAVARGAAYYGMVRRGEGVRITANLARSYYLQVDADPPRAVCLVPGTAQPGQDFLLEGMTFELTLDQPVEFPLCVSSTRLTDRPGDVVEVEPEQMTPLPPIRTVIRATRRRERGTLPVKVLAHLTEIGTLELSCRELEGQRSWRLQFDVRSATQTDVLAHHSRAEAEGIVDEAQWDQCRTVLDATFGAGADASPEGLIKRLQAALGSPRDQWPTSLLRRMWQRLVEQESGRRRSAKYEARWLNLLGFTLRPGFGFALDDWRVAETWRQVQGKLVFNTPTCRNESLILWRRLAGGLSRGQQIAVAEPLLSPVRSLHRRYATGRGRAGDVTIDPGESPEIWRLLGSLELLSIGVKVELGDMIVQLLEKRKLEKVHPAMIWALGRLGQRVPLFGPLNTVVPQSKAAEWLEALLRREGRSVEQMAVMQIARRTDDRHRDLTAALRREAADWLQRAAAPPHLVQLVSEGGSLDAEERDQVFGESLPAGLRILP